MRRVGLALAAGCLLVAATACSADEAGTIDPAAPYSPTASPSPTVTLMSAPADYTDIPGAGFTISAPPEFQRSERTSSNGEPMLVLERPSSEPAIPQRVAVIRDVDPVSAADEQSFTLEVSKSAGAPETPVTRVQLPTEAEGTSAYLVTWVESRPTQAGATVPVTYWQLMYQTDASLILNVVAFAPSAEFEESEVSTILRSFEATPGTSA